MRITLVCPFDPRPPQVADGAATVGGVERVFDQVAAHLARRGHQVTLLCSTAGPGSRTMEGGVRVVRQHRRGTFLRTPVCDLAALIPRDSQVVHVPATYPFTTVPVLRRARRLGIPAVLDFHFEPVPETPLGRLGAIVYGAFAPANYRRAAAVLVRSHGYAAHSPSLAEVDRELLRIVPNGIDPTRFRPDGPAHKGDYLLFVGRLVPYKGLHVLIRALARAKIPNPLVVVGDGPERPRLEAMAKRRGVDVRFLGRVPDERLPALYRGARLTILPSVNRQEAFGIALIESMACGTPVVASHLPGVEEVAGLGGLVAMPGDATGLGQRIKTALGYAALPRGPELARRIHRLYSWHAVAQRLEAVYAQAIHPKSGARGRAAPAPAPTRQAPAVPRLHTPQPPAGHMIASPSLPRIGPGVMAQARPAPAAPLRANTQQVVVPTPLPPAASFAPTTGRSAPAAFAASGRAPQGHDEEVSPHAHPRGHPVL